jgi:tRNA A37 threonylcarbamoyladenosine dehydratase
MFSRLEQLTSKETVAYLQTKTVLVVGLGGVGGHAVEALARSAFGTIILVDQDSVEVSNLNRQIVALHSTLNKPKVAVLKERILDINPSCNVITYHHFYDIDSKAVIWENDIDYVIDCIDTITFKIDIVKECLERNIPFISVMGTGNKFHPEQLEILPLSKTEYDPIARVMRQKLKKEWHLKDIMVVASKEVPRKVDSTIQSPSSNAFVPATAGILAASYIFNKAISETT